jgi:hypothetical protein
MGCGLASPAGGGIPAKGKSIPQGLKPLPEWGGSIAGDKSPAYRTRAMRDSGRAGGSITGDESPGYRAGVAWNHVHFVAFAGVRD